MNSTELQALTDDELRARGTTAGILNSEGMRREELIAALQETGEAMTRSEERLVASTEVYETGRARLRKYVVTEEVQITVQVRREELRLEQEEIPVGGRQLVEDPDVFGPSETFGGPDGGTIFEVTLHEERPVVTTEIVPVQRVRLTKLVHTDDHVISGQVRKERIEADLPGQPRTTLD
ncbi:YsnF/AvaK domain-containing protein [Actinoplanes sp. TFC3]|uniref:YsnF/AvaK domain-containing protein n=1 Tax=Actinoplanes sp. TFC3 TaxID=1710355 RepID=UPI000B26C610|nr:YsnF/AvaK domain-containing protein [Actinoplanes sp. TFC3]